MGNARETIRPEFHDGIGYCSDDCPHHDGKRCELLGRRPSSVCEPWAERTAADLVTLQALVLRVRSACGNPDPAEGCRAVLELTKGVRDGR